MNSPKFPFTLTALALSGLLAGCAGTGPNTQQGVVGGAALGALAGAIIGNNSGGHNAGAGALIGAAAGTCLGLTLPRLVHRWNLDPKIASGPAVLALTDVITLTSYLALASAVFGK